MTTESLKNYWHQLRLRITERLAQGSHSLESLQIRQRRFNLSNRGLGHRTLNGHLVHHRYNQYVGPIVNEAQVEKSH